jgi:hypothetical protein
MSDENVVKEATDSKGRDYRVRLALDESPDEPYDDGSVPLWRGEWHSVGAGGAEWRVEQVGMTSFDASDVALGEAIARFRGPTEPAVERWLRAFHGATVVETWHSGDAWYVAADTAKWREAMGVTPEQIRKEAEHGSLMSEYKSWVEGEVYGYIIERQGVQYTVLTETTGEVIGTRREDVWVEVEDGSLWGLYGHEWAVQAAEEALADHLVNVQAEGS